LNGIFPLAGQERSSFGLQGFEMRFEMSLQLSS
jgi:hypothetical protein